MSGHQNYEGIEEGTSPNTHAVVEQLLLAEPAVRTVLDIPCGEGAFTARLAERGLAVHAGDCQPILKVPNVPFSACDMNQPLPFKENEFDAVVCIDGIEHLERPFDFVRESRRILRMGGVLLISTPNISSLRSRWRWFMTGFHHQGKSPLNEAQPTPYHHIRLFSFADLRYTLHANGFRITAIRCNRVKPIAWLYAPVIPLAQLITLMVFNKEEKDPVQRLRNGEIMRQMFSKAVLFGETLIVKAVRERK